MPSAAHADQLGTCIGTLEAVADTAPEAEAGTLSASADVLRSYAASLDHDIEVVDPGRSEVHHLQNAVVFLRGKVKNWARPEQRRVLQRAIHLLEDRVKDGDDP